MLYYTFQSFIMILQSHAVQKRRKLEKMALFTNFLSPLLLIHGDPRHPHVSFPHHSSHRLLVPSSIDTRRSGTFCLCSSGCLAGWEGASFGLCVSFVVGPPPPVGLRVAWYHQHQNLSQSQVFGFLLLWLSICLPEWFERRLNISVIWIILLILLVWKYCTWASWLTYPLFSRFFFWNILNS